MADSGKPPLPQGVAYGLVCGKWLVIAVWTITHNLIKVLV
jgi:hypothetical protein